LSYLTIGNADAYWSLFNVMTFGKSPTRRFDPSNEYPKRSPQYYELTVSGIRLLNKAFIANCVGRETSWKIVSLIT